MSKKKDSPLIEEGKPGPYRVLFLDIDGVLNSKNAWDECLQVDQRQYFKLDPRALRKLKGILDVWHDLRLVISSSWGKIFSIVQLEEMMNLVGSIPKNKIVGVTPKLGRRSNEIEAWRQNHPEIVSWAIIDDDPNAEGAGFIWKNGKLVLPKRSVLTSFEIGWEAQHSIALHNIFVSDRQVEYLVEQQKRDATGRSVQGHA